MTAEKKCPSCSHVNRPQARFCAQCGTALPTASTSSPDQTPMVDDKRWQRRPGEVAARVAARDLPGRMRRDLIIEEGTAAILLRDGKVVGEQGPGRHPMASLHDRFFSLGDGPDVIALLVDTGVIRLEFLLDELWSADPVRLSLSCQIAVRLKDAGRFVRNVLRERSSYTEHDLRALLEPELRGAAQVYLAEHSVKQLNETLAVRLEHFGVDVREQLRDLFDETGLEFLRVRVFDLYHPQLNEQTRREEKLYLGSAELDLQERELGLETRGGQQVLSRQARADELAAEQRRQQLQQRQRLFDVYTEEQVQALAEEEAEVAQFERRAQRWERMRRATLQDKISAAASDEEWAKFVDATDRSGLLRADDLARFREELAWQGEDRRSERAHAVAMAQLYAEFERKGAQLAEQYKHDRARLANELTLAREETLGRLQLRQQQVALELEIQEAEAAHQRRQRELDVMAAREERIKEAQSTNDIALANARTEADIENIEREQDRLDLELAFMALERMKLSKRQDEEERRRIIFEDWARKQKAELEAEERRLAIELRRAAQVHEQELARMRQFGELTIEGQIVFAADIERAGLLAGLARTRELKGLNEEQILAMVAEKQPAAIEAIRARHQAAMEGKLSEAEAAKWKALTEEQSRSSEALRAQMQAQLDLQQRLAGEAADRQERTAREAAERQERIAGKALDSATEIAKAFAQKPDLGPPIVITPGSGGASAVEGQTGAGPAASGGEVQACPRCRVKAAVGEKFCANCGYQFYEA